MQQLVQNKMEELHQIIIANEPENFSLFGGSLGVALYHFNLYKSKGATIDAEKAVALVEKALQHLEDESFTYYGYSFCNGIAGLAYILHLFEKESLITLEEEDHYSIDDFLFKTAKELLQNSNRHDFLHGAMGILYYFLQKLPNPTIAAYTYEITQLFCDKAVYTNKGIWFKNYVVPDDKEEDINFSLSHGQAGFFIILSEAYRRGITITVIPLLLEKGIELLMQYKRDIPTEPDQFSMFPTAVHETGPVFSARLAWCYGDLNIALALYKIGAVLHKDMYTKLADEITNATLARKSEMDTATMDSHICHGSAGLAQHYYAIYKITNNDAHKDAWHYWLHKTILDFLPKELETDYYKNKETDLLEGLVGINLALLTYLNEEELNWSEILLL